MYDREQMSHESYRTLSQEFGDFYTQAIEVLINKDTPHQQKLDFVKQRSADLPQEIQPFVQRAIETIVQAAETNQLFGHQEGFARLPKDEQEAVMKQGILTLYLELLTQGKAPNSLIKNILPETEIHAFFPGMYNIHFSSKARSLIAQYTPSFENTVGTRVLLQSKDTQFQFQFLISIDDEEEKPTQDFVNQHEISHFLLLALESSNELRESTETDPETKAIFIDARDELIAYIITVMKRPDLSFLDLTPYALVAKTRALSVDQIRMLFEILRVMEKNRLALTQAGMSVAALIYPILTSRSFAELQHRVQKLDVPNIEQVQVRPISRDDFSRALRASIPHSI